MSFDQWRANNANVIIYSFSAIIGDQIVLQVLVRSFFNRKIRVCIVFLCSSHSSSVRVTGVSKKKNALKKENAIFKSYLLYEVTLIFVFYYRTQPIG